MRKKKILFFYVLLNISHCETIIKIRIWPSLPNIWGYCII